MIDALGTAKDKQQLARIVLPESGDMRILQAAIEIDKADMAQIILLGDKKQLEQKLAAMNYSKPTSIQVVDNRDTQLKKHYAEVLWRKRKHKGLAKHAAQNQLDKALTFALLMLEAADADAVIAGADTSTQDVVRGALQIIGMKHGCQLVSSFFLMVFDDTHSHYAQQMIFADCAMNIAPDAKQLAHIAGSSIKSAETILTEAPRVAFLSFSTNGSADHELARKVKLATQLTKECYPHYQIIGEVQVDAALDKNVMDAKYPNAEFTPPANVLIFPSLEAANISYKLVQRLTNAKAVGPILQGLNKPVNDLSRGCSVADIVNTIAVTSQMSD